VLVSERDDVKPWVSAALEEYKVHRAAYLEGLASAQRTLALGITAVGILVAGAFNVWDSSDPLPATLLFLVAIPLVCALVVLQWAGQMLFLVLRHRYLLALESTLRNAYPSGPTTLFTWEDLWAEYFRPTGGKWKPDHRWLTNATVPLFGLVAVGSLVLGAAKGWDDARAVVASAAIVEFVAFATLGIRLLRALSRALPARPHQAVQGVEREQAAVPR
jgi:hypothetical protein